MIQGEIRDFVYLDDQSVNEHLSSLGVGIATSGQTAQTTESEQTSRQRLDAFIPTVGSIGGAEKERRQLTSESEQLKLDLTAPYRFQMLLAQLDASDIEIKDPAEDNVSRGDIIRKEYDLEPMLHSRLEVALRYKETFKQTQTDDDVADTFKNAHDLLDRVNRVTNNEFALYGFGEGMEIGMTLSRDAIRKSILRAFGNETTYTVFGRVKRDLTRLENFDNKLLDNDRPWSEISDDKYWSPIPIQDADGKDNTIRLLGERVEELPGEHPYTEYGSNTPISGITAHVVHPLAIYW